MKFEKGYTYIVYSNTYNLWYLVRQISMKGWTAFNFTNINVDFEDICMTKNGVALWEILEPRDDYKRYITDGTLRRDMFDILKYGQFRGEL